MVETGHSFAATDNVVYRLLAFNAAGKKTKIQRLSAINQSPAWDYLAERRQRPPRRDWDNRLELLYSDALSHMVIHAISTCTTTTNVVSTY